MIMIDPNQRLLFCREHHITRVLLVLMINVFVPANVHRLVILAAVLLMRNHFKWHLAVAVQIHSNSRYGQFPSTGLFERHSYYLFS